MEIVPELAKSAQRILSDLGYRNVTVRQGDGYKGWPEQAPFDGIMVTAAPPEVLRRSSTNWRREGASWRRLA